MGIHLNDTVHTIPAWPQVAYSLCYGLSQVAVTGPFEGAKTELGSQGISLQLGTACLTTKRL